jgi:hypothetical protein
MLINDDLPTFERPIKAYSGKVVRGQLSIVGLLVTNFADRITMMIAVLI